MRPSSCCCIVVRQSSARLQESGLLLLASGEPDEPDSEEARQGKARLEGVPYSEVDQRVLRFAGSSCACPPSESPSAHSKHPSPSPRRHAAQPRCPGPERIRPKPQGLSNSKRNAHPFLNNLARRASLLPRAPPRDCTTYGLGRQGAPSDAVGLALPIPHHSFSRWLPCRTSPVAAAAAACCLMLSFPALPCHSLMC
jgi:hypothetical protein